MGMGGRGWATAGLVVVASVVVSIGASGCSSGSSSTTATTLSPHDTYVSQATAICTQMKGKADDLNKTAATLADESQLGSLLDQNVGILQSALTDLKGLTPDAGDAVAVKAYLADLTDLLDETKAVVTALQAGDQTGGAAAQTRQQASQKAANDAAAALGLDACVIT